MATLHKTSDGFIISDNDEVPFKTNTATIEHISIVSLSKRSCKQTFIDVNKLPNGNYRQKENLGDGKYYFSIPRSPFYVLEVRIKQ